MHPIYTRGQQKDHGFLSYLGCFLCPGMISVSSKEKTKPIAKAVYPWALA